MKAIEVKDFKKHFGKVKAVDGISFEVEAGEIFGFLGPNGAGKTTTIRAMMDFARPSAGEILIFGKNSISESVDVKEEIGHLPAELRLYDAWTGKEHIDYLESLRSRKSKAEELTKKLDLDTSIRFHNLSSGNKQKLGLVLALMFEPKLLILDEPTAGLDPILQNEVYRILEELKNRNSTIFMSSHNLSEVDRICTKVAIIKEGKLIATEDIQSLKEKRMHQAIVHFAKNFERDDFEFANVSVQEEMTDGLILDIKGDINPLLKKLANYELKDVEISHATLEEIFLEFYN